MVIIGCWSTPSGDASASARSLILNVAHSTNKFLVSRKAMPELQNGVLAGVMLRKDKKTDEDNQKGDMAMVMRRNVHCSILGAIFLGVCGLWLGRERYTVRIVTPAHNNHFTTSYLITRSVSLLNNAR